MILSLNYEDESLRDQGLPVKKTKGDMSTVLDITNQKHHWIGLKPEPDKYFGFIYIITNKITGQMYIGKKQYWVNRNVRQFNSSRRKKVSSCSKWQYYKGSSKYLHEEMALYGTNNFRYEIVLHCSSKGTLHYAEIELQVFADVLRAKFMDGTPAFYNRSIAGTKFIPKDECPEIAERQRGLKNTIFKAISNGNHPTLGKGHTDKTKQVMSDNAKRWWEGMTKDEREEHGRKTARKGEKNGRAKLTREQVEEIRAAWENKVFKSKSALGRNWGLGPSQVGRILSGEQWPVDLDEKDGEGNESSSGL